MHCLLAGVLSARKGFSTHFLKILSFFLVGLFFIPAFSIELECAINFVEWKNVGNYFDQVERIGKTKILHGALL